MTESKKKAITKELPAEIFVCTTEKVDKKPVCGTIGIGRTFQLTVYDYRTHTSVKHALLRRVTIDGEDKKKQELSLPGEPPKSAKFWSAKVADTCRDALKKHAILKKEKAEGKKPSKELLQELKPHMKYIENGKYRKIIEEREDWIAYMQTGLKMLKAYDGSITKCMDKDFGQIVSAYWNHWTGGKFGKYVPTKHWYKAANLLLRQLKGKWVTDDKGKILIPLPENYDGEVEIEFANIKILDPNNAEKAVFGQPGWPFPRYKGVPSDHRVDYDLVTAKSEQHNHDKAGSKEMESRWNYVVGAKSYAFQNFIKVKIDAPTEKERTKPIQKWTLALVWCQPVWTEVENKYIYDPVDPHHPDDSTNGKLPRPHNRRGLEGRGLADGSLPTLLANTIGTHNRSKHYGVFGNKGRHKNGAPWWHNGIDCAGTEGDPVFAAFGGKRTAETKKTRKKKIKSSSSGNVMYITSWIPGGPRFLQLAHLKSDEPFTEEIGTVKAGDYIANMGREGNFEPPYPTHVHFIWHSGSTLYHPVAGFEAHGALMPHNGLPRLLPCGGHYPDYDEGAENNPKNCKFDYNGFVSGAGDFYCFAVAELACPFMPETISIEDLKESGSRKAKRRLQAQLKWLFKNNKDQYADPGKIDGDIGDKPPSAKMIGSDGHRTVRKWVPADPPPAEWPRLFEADENECFPLVDHEKVGPRYKVKLTKEHVSKYKEKAKANGQELNAGDIVLVYHTGTIKECKVEYLNNSRKAIKKFNEQHDPEGEYEISENGLKILNNLTGLVKDKDGNSNGLRLQRPTDPLI